MPTYAAPSDVQALLGRELTDDETTLVERRLAQAEREILRRIPDLAEKIADGDLDVDDVVDIEAEAVLRVVRNPDGYSMESDGSYSYQLNRENSSGRLEILPREWELLGVRQSRMFQLVPTTSPATRPSFGSGG